MYKYIFLTHGGTFSLLYSLLLRNGFLQFNLLLVSLFLLTLWNCYLTYRISKTAHVILSYFYALQPKQS